MDTNGKNGNGTWKNYVLTIISGLILIAIVGTIVFERDTAKELGKHEERLIYLERRIDEKTISRFTSEDGRRLEVRIERLEQHK